MYILYSWFISRDKYFADSFILAEKNFEESFRLTTPITRANIITMDTFEVVAMVWWVSCLKRCLGGICRQSVYDVNGKLVIHMILMLLYQS